MLRQALCERFFFVCFVFCLSLLMPTFADINNGVFGFGYYSSRSAKEQPKSQAHSKSQEKFSQIHC